MIKHKYGKDFTISICKPSDVDKDILGAFSCDNPSIDNFIHNECLYSQKEVTYLFLDEENNKIIGFCSISCDGIPITEINKQQYIYKTSLPCIEVDYYAIDEAYRKLPLKEDSSRHETLSQALLLLMIDHIKSISKNYVGATHICLYSVPDAVRFYERCGFEDFKPYMHRDELPYLSGCIPMFYQINE